jgi:hypothetical protein
VIELVLSNHNNSLTVQESNLPGGAARLEVTHNGVSASCHLKPETVERLMIELHLLKQKYETGGYGL